MPDLLVLKTAYRYLEDRKRVLPVFKSVCKIDWLHIVVVVVVAVDLQNALR